MVGVITIKDIEAIKQQYGKSIAELAKKWKGTYLNFLLHYKLI